MKTRIGLFWILSLLIIYSSTSCSESAANKKEKNNQTEASNNSLLEGEDFEVFLKSFSKMPTFQRQRVKFPVEATVLNPSDSGMNTVLELIDYHDWFLLDFSYDSTFTTRQMDSYEQNVKLYTDSALIEHRGIDNGIYANYLFTKIDGKWFLESFTDISY